MGCGADMSVPIEESSLQMVIYLTAGSALGEFCENFAKSLYERGLFRVFWRLCAFTAYFSRPSRRILRLQT